MQHIKMVDSSINMNNATSGAKGSAASSKRPLPDPNQQRLQSFSSPKNQSGHHQNTNLATMGRKDSQDGSLRRSGNKALGGKEGDMVPPSANGNIYP